MIQYHVFPGGKKRIVTFSYDDGPDNDERLVGIFNRYGVKATFHISGDYRNVSPERAEALRKRYEGHEVSLHTLQHGWLSRMPAQSIVSEINENRKGLERIFGYPIVGMSYPSGGPVTDLCESCCRACGIVYARSTADSRNFYLPENFMRWSPSCHQRDAGKLSETFLSSLDSRWTHPLFYIWGHSHEFRTEEDWKAIENVVAGLSGNDKIWYATNIGIYDYMNAQKQLKISYDEKIFVNPTAIDVWVEKDLSRIIRIPAGQTVVLE